MYDENAPKPAPGVLDLNIPILGVCYGMQYLAQQAGGDVKRAGKREYGKADLTRYEAAPGHYDLVLLTYVHMLDFERRELLRNCVRALAPGGTLLVIAHDSHDMAGAAADPEQTRAFDHEAYVDTDAIAAALARAGWTVDVHDRRERPAGAVSTHHVHDVVLRARRAG